MNSLAIKNKYISIYLASRLGYIRCVTVAHDKYLSDMLKSADHTSLDTERLLHSYFGIGISFDEYYIGYRITVSPQ